VLIAWCLNSLGASDKFSLRSRENHIMAVSQELLEILVCPACKAPVKLTADGQGLKCGQCRRVYPIQEDIPVMLVDEARIEAE
jgi:uncharacterized protein